jgi:hypothetical protein
MLRRLSLLVLLWLAAVPFAAAQTVPYRHDLLKLLPDDFAVCVVLHDLRGHAARWEQADWLKRFKQTPVGQALLDAAEMKHLDKFQSELKKHFDLDWPTVRDDILGDTLVLAYTPGPKTKPDEERGLFLLHVRKPEILHRLIDKLNKIQEKSGELKSLTEKEYKGNTFYCRQEAAKSNYYFFKDSLAVFTVKEESMHAVMDRLAARKETPWAKRFAQAGAERALVTMCVNPRMLDAELAPGGKKDDPLPSYWRALDAIFVTVSIQDDAELRIAIQADADKLPKWARPAFTQTIPNSSLWQRFPERSIVTFASQTDFAGGAEALKLLMPEKDRKKLTSDWQSGIGAVMRLDLFKDLLPNIGPDWGVCVLPSKDAKQLPAMMFALEVKPGTKDPPVDQTLLKAVEFFAGFAVLDHNKNHPEAIIRVQSLKQGNVEVKYLSGDKAFPPGFQPACALKDGFLIFATWPEAIAEFRLRAKPAGAPKESVLLRISAPELAKLLDHRREHILSSLTAGQQMAPEKAKQNLENVIALLGLFERVTLSQHGDAGQASWIIRLSPAQTKK